MWKKKKYEIRNLKPSESIKNLKNTKKKDKLIINIFRYVYGIIYDYEN